LWKQTAVVPVFKKGNSTIVSNYRPISNLNNFSKIFEFIVYDHLCNFFKYKLNPSQQYGFRKFNSTAINLVTYLNSIIPSVSTQGQTDSVYFDLTKAFDIVPHNILLRKLSNFGLYSSHVDWFRSYLFNRQSFVRISGVPQGSTLDPLLFNIFINDICDSIHNSQSLLFADDLKIYHSISDVDDCKLL
jgi:retron-type reverse transcriptase